MDLTKKHGRKVRSSKILKDRDTVVNKGAWSRVKENISQLSINLLWGTLREMSFIMDFHKKTSIKFVQFK